MLASTRRVRTTINIWPGYVDALSALLMLVIFTLLIFTLAQVFLSELISNKDQELEDLNARLSEISSILGLEQDKNETLDGKIKSISEEYSRSLEAQFDLMGQVDELSAVTLADKEKIELQLSTIVSLQQDIGTLRQLRDSLEKEVGLLSSSVTSKEGQIGILRDRSKSLEARLAGEEERTLLAQRELEEKQIRVEELFSLVAVGREALEDEKELSSSARAQVDLLTRRIGELKQQLTQISQALKLAEEKSQTQEVELADLGSRLNILLAKQVSELERYRSEFFGRLRKVLAANPNIRVVGDRFVFPSELLFASGSDRLGDEGKKELAKLAVSLREIASKIPQDVSWILRVDGHTDRQPINTQRFPSNWELSTARAVSVVRYLALQDIPQHRLAATGFGEFHPVDDTESVEAYRRNRRIEIKLTDR
ncbi:MAG: peptidoglycan -binding protein [Gammaproteobacteria bacterium]|nr:peptidoglycan -binding protein [Gammaproteobacteria bacterium]